MSVCTGLKPERVFFFFEEISKIPRGSGNEEAVAKYIESFAKELSLEVIRDGVNNVFVRKPAHSGFENAPVVLLQGHTDMVCEKNAGTVHDFEKDPIKLCLEGDILSADGTTLGADDGVAVAMMMAILEDKSLEIGAVECLFTTGEEVGLCGMKAFDKGLVKAKYMINLDSEDSSCAVVSCAGGVRSDFTFEEMPLERCNGKITLTVSGLAGGHSGADIHLNRANAIKIAFDILSKIELPRIILIDGGNKDNAIPRECVIEFTCPDMTEAVEIIEEAAAEVKETLSESDRGFVCNAVTERGEFHCFSEKNSRRIITLTTSLPYGVIAMSRAVEGFVETSSNVGIAKTGKDCVSVTTSSRSSVEESLDEVIKSLDSLASFASVSSITHRDRYPGWSPVEGSKLQAVYKTVFEELCGDNARFEGIHAGLECGLIKSEIPTLDIISVGPDAMDIHTPDEKLSVSSTEKVYNIVIKMLEKIARM